MTARRRRPTGPEEPPHPADTIASVERTLPHNLEAERSVIGAVLVQNALFDIAREVLHRGDFYRDAHARIWDAIVRLIDERRSQVDFVTLKEELGRVGMLDEVGGPAYVASLADGIPQATNIRHYAGIVKDKSRLRGVIYAANRAVADAYEAQESADEILQRADAAFLDLGDGTGARLRSLSEGVAALFRRIEYRVEHKGELTGVDTGFESINGETLGWQRGDFNVIAARPSIGKTAFILNSIINGARAAKPVRTALFSLEMTEVDLHDRIIAILAGVDAMRIRSGQLGALDMERIAHALQVFQDLPIFIDERVGLKVEDIRSAARRMQAEHGLDHVVVDYGQLVKGSSERRGASRNEEMTDIVTKFKNLGGELRVPVTMLSQLTRANEKRNDPRPKLSDLRESGAIEQVAALVGFLHRKNHREGGSTEFIIAKQRNGPTGTVMLTFDRDLQTFTDGGDPLPADAPAAPRAPRKRAPKRTAGPLVDEIPPPGDDDN
jgi:replicative DNA helicase